MSGHSKWATIKHKKGAADAKRGKMFSKLAKEITIAAKTNGDVGSNPTLRTLVQKAKGINMPSDNIDKAIKKGTGEIVAEALEEITYEGYAAGGIGLVVYVLTVITFLNILFLEFFFLFGFQAGIIVRKQITHPDLLFLE